MGFNISAQPYLELITLYNANEPSSTLYTGKDQIHIKNTWNIASLNAPFIIDKRNIVLFSPGYETRNYTSSADPLNIYTLYFPLTYEHTFNDTSNKLSGTLIYRFNSTTKFKPGINNDLLGGAVLFTHNFSSTFGMKAGLYYNRELFGNYFIPLLGFDWQPNDRLFVWGLLPQSATLDYRFTNNIHGGINYYSPQDSYRLKGDNAYFFVLEVQLRLFVDYYIPKTPLAITAEAGHTMLRNYLYYDYSKNPNEEVIKPTESAIFRIGLSWRFTTNNAFKTQRTLAR